MKCIICDIDGTIADLGHRLHFVQKKPVNWKKFFEGIPGDKPIQNVIDLIHAVANPYTGICVVYVTGRPEDYRELTRKQLIEFGCPDYQNLYMRPANDTRGDFIVKKQILQGILEDGFEPLVVIDDRQSVVDMWREEGLTCLQCKADDAMEFGVTGKLTLMVGPSGSGKTSYCFENYDSQDVISSDYIREQLTGSFKDMSRDNAVFEAVHAVAKLRCRHGLPTVIDATNIRRKSRVELVKLVPPHFPIDYVVVNRSMEDKRATGGWRNELHFDLLAKHEEVFNQNLKDILAGDGFDNVFVRDKREFK